jgi:hypothetical protein
MAMPAIPRQRFQNIDTGADQRIASNVRNQNMMFKGLETLDVEQKKEKKIQDITRGRQSLGEINRIMEQEDSLMNKMGNNPSMGAKGSGYEGIQSVWRDFVAKKVAGGAKPTDFPPQYSRPYLNQMRDALVAEVQARHGVDISQRSAGGVERLAEATRKEEREYNRDLKAEDREYKKDVAELAEERAQARFETQQFNITKRAKQAQKAADKRAKPTGRSAMYEYGLNKFTNKEWTAQQLEQWVSMIRGGGDNLKFDMSAFNKPKPTTKEKEQALDILLKNPEKYWKFYVKRGFHLSEELMKKLNVTQKMVDEIKNAK